MGWGVSALGALTRLLPDPLMARLLPPGRSFDPAAPPPLPDFSEAAGARLLVAPVNAAGQGEAWARAAERELDGVAAISMQVGGSGGFAHEAGIRVPPPVFAWSRDWQAELRRIVEHTVTHVLLESGRALLAGGIRGDLHADLRRLAAWGIPVALVWHGSDVRDGARHAREHPRSPYVDPSWAHDELDEIAARNRALAARSALPSLVSTPDLLDDVPGAMWLPVVVDPAAWAADAPPLGHGGRLRVVHAPSSGAVKGSQLIEPVVLKLAAEGVIEYRRVERVAHADMPDVVQQADIVLEQFRLGSYGVAAVEAMAAGRIVIGDVDERVAESVESATGARPPIVSVAPEALERALRDMAADPSAALAAAAQGPAFVTRAHDGAHSAAVIARALGLPGGREPDG